MKKTLAAMAVLGAFAGSAFAADVTVYGVVDLGLNYQHQKVTPPTSSPSTPVRTPAPVSVLRARKISATA